MFIVCDTRGMCRASRGRPLSLWITKGCSASPGTAPAPNCPPIRQAGAWVTGASPLPLEDLILIDRDGLAEPVLALGHRDVLPRHGWRAAGAILHREVEVLLRREMARVRAPGLPLLARSAATGQQECGSDHERTPVLPVHGVILLRKSDCAPSYRRVGSRSISRSC